MLRGTRLSAHLNSKHNPSVVQRYLPHEPLVAGAVVSPLAALAVVFVDEDDALGLAKRLGVIPIRVLSRCCFAIYENLLGPRLSHENDGKLFEVSFANLRSYQLDHFKAGCHGPSGAGGEKSAVLMNHLPRDWAWLKFFWPRSGSACSVS
jgi:hypothetical protein